jgi:uncharacterized repeat protein (TIGR01451 family)
MVWYIGDIANGSTVTLELVFLVNGSENVTNVVNVSGNGNNTGDNGTNSSNLTTNGTYNLSIAKVVNVTSAKIGDLVRYTITVVNNGPDVAPNVTVSEYPGSSLVYNATDSVSQGYFNSSDMVWYIGDIANGSTVTLELIFLVNNSVNTTNIVDVSGNGNNTGNNSADANITVYFFVNISIVKTVNVSGSVLNGDLVKYTITVTNNGPDNATGLFVVDVLDSRLIYISSNATIGSYDISNSTWTIGELANGDTTVLNIVVRLNGTGNIANIANVFLDQNNTGDNTTPDNEANITVLPSANLVIVKTSNVTGSVLNGDLIHYTITVTNNGPDGATGVYVIDKLDKRLVYISSNGSIGSYSSVSSTWTIGSLVNGQTAVLDIIVRVNGTGNISNVANVTANQKNSIDTNDSTDKNDVFSLPLVNLKITINSNEQDVILGKTVTYTVTVTNLGPDKATDVVAHVDFDVGLLYVSHKVAKGIFTYELYDNSFKSSKSNTHLSGLWRIGTLFNGESVILTILTKTSALGTLNTYANVSSNETLGDKSSANDRVDINVKNDPRPEPTPEPIPNNKTGSSTMKETGTPVIVIILFAILGLVGFGYRKREEGDKK